MSESMPKKGWLGGFLGALGCVIAGDAATICCQTYGVEGAATTISWLAPLLGFIYFFFFKFWRKMEAVDEGLSGRMRRRTYFVSVIVWGIVIAGLSALAAFGICNGVCTYSECKREMPKFMALAELLSPCITSLVLFPTAVRRLHDIGWTCRGAQWQVLIAMLTMMGFMFPAIAGVAIIVGALPNLVFGLILLFHGGTAGDNKYGANPRTR